MRIDVRTSENDANDQRRDHTVRPRVAIEREEMRNVTSYHRKFKSRETKKAEVRDAHVLSPSSKMDLTLKSTKRS